MIRIGSSLVTGFLVLILSTVIGPPTVGAMDADRGFGDAWQQLRPDEFRIDSTVLAAEDGDRHRISDVPLPGHGMSVEFELTRFRVFARDARILVHTAEGDVVHPVPDNIYYRGTVVGEKGSTVILTVLEGGEARGLVVTRAGQWVFSGDAFNKSLSSTLRVRRIEAVVELDHDAQAFECGTDRLDPLSRDKASGEAVAPQATNAGSVSYTARIAVETDNEFYNLFGNATDAANYVADLIAFGSAIYSAEVDTSWVLQDLSLWAPGQTDPWTQSGSTCRFLDFGQYWNDNNQSISRTTAAFFSGASGSSGIAWVGVLCSGPLNYSNGGCPGLSPSYGNFAGAYAYIGGMSGNFDIDNPGILWDSLAVVHEIGHNFNSPHTHCYGGLEGNSSPIDQCYGGECGQQSGCHCGGTSLPSDCPNSWSGCGTIMSYCHVQWGYSNISPTLGLGHPYGIAPERVPARMSAHVASRATSYPGCLEYVAVDEVFFDGFEDGDTAAWSNSIP